MSSPPKEHKNPNERRPSRGKREERSMGVQWGTSVGLNRPDDGTGRGTLKNAFIGLIVNGKSSLGKKKKDRTTDRGKLLVAGGGKKNHGPKLPFCETGGLWVQVGGTEGDAQKPGAHAYANKKHANGGIEGK